VRLSVIIPALNEEACIAACLEHASRLEPVDLIVADGGSRDRTREICQAFGCCFVDSPSGRGVQLNHGAQRGTGDVFLFLHADNWLERQARDQLISALRDPGVQGGAFRQHIESPRGIYRWIERGNAFRAGWLGLPYGDQGIFVRSDAFRKLGGFPCVPIMEDVIFMRDLRRASRPVLLPGPIHVSPRRWERTGVWRQTVRNWYLLAAYMRGVPLETLAEHYARTR
jgi:rSAM/selenodomain-associated transferase 2